MGRAGAASAASTLPCTASSLSLRAWPGAARLSACLACLACLTAECLEVLSEFLARAPADSEDVEKARQGPGTAVAQH